MEIGEQLIRIHRVNADVVPIPPRTHRFPLWQQVVCVQIGLACLVGLTVIILPKLPLADPAQMVKHVDSIEILKSTQGFQALRAEEQAKLLRYVSGTNQEISVPARQALDTLLYDPDSYLGKPQTFRKFLTEQPGAPGDVPTEASAIYRRHLPYHIGTPQTIKQFSFRVCRADALEYDVWVGKRRVTVYLSHIPPLVGRSLYTIQDIAGALAILPEASRKLITGIYVEPGNAPSDAYWQKRYHQSDFSAYMNADTDGVIHIYPHADKPSPDYIAGTLIHETGHVLSDGAWGDDPDAPAWRPWRVAIRKDGIVASRYARASAQEDFAETFQLYQQVKNTPQEQEIRQLMPERFALLEHIKYAGHGVQ